MKFNKFLIGLAALAISAIHLQALDTFNSFSGGGTAINAGTNYLIIPGQGFNNPGGGNVAGNTVVNFLSYRGFSANPITLQSYYSTNKVALVASNSLGANNASIFTGTTTNYIALYSIASGLPAVGGFVTNLISSPVGITNANAVFILYHLGAADWRLANEYLVGVGNAATTIQVTNKVGTVLVLQPVVFTTTPAYACLDGDELYQETSAGAAAISVPSSATAVNNLGGLGGGVLSFGKSKPSLLVISSAGAGTNTIDAANAVSQ